MQLYPGGGAKHLEGDNIWRCTYDTCISRAATELVDYGLRKSGVFYFRILRLYMFNCSRLTKVIQSAGSDGPMLWLHM